MRPLCGICQRRVPATRYHFCDGCVQGYSLNPWSSADWPEWIKEAAWIERRRRYGQTKFEMHEVAMADAEMLLNGPED